MVDLEENTSLTYKKRSYGSFFLDWCNDFKNVFFEKNNLAHSEVVEVKFWNSSSFCEFSSKIFVDFGFWWNSKIHHRLTSLTSEGAQGIFQKLHFWNQRIPRKKMRYFSALFSKSSVNLSTDDLCKVWFFVIRGHFLFISIEY